MPGLYSHTTRATGTVLTATIYNGDHQNHIDNQIPTMTDDYSVNVAQMQSVVNPGTVGAEVLATSLAGEIERLRYVIKTMHGGAQWYPGEVLIPKSIGTTKGDVISWTGSGTPARVAIGTEGQALIAQAAAAGGVAWASIDVPSGALLPYAGRSAPGGYLMCDGTTVSRATYANLFAALVKSATVTTPIASPGKVNWTGHGLANNDPVKFAVSGGSLPTGLVAGTTYYVKNKTANDFEVAATPGGASINFTGSSSGTQTGINAPYGDGDGSTTFTLPDLRGRAPFGRDDMNGASAASRITSGGSGIKGNATGETGGAETHTLTTAQLAAHAHGVQDYASHAYLPNTNVPLRQGGFSASAGYSTNNAGSGNAHNNMPPALIMNYIIKT